MASRLLALLLCACAAHLTTARRHKAFRALPPRHLVGKGPLGWAALGGRDYNFDVTDFGAQSHCNNTVATGFDNTKAFQAALDAAAQAGGDYVIAPAGCYFFKGSLNIPPSVSLQGSYLSVPSHDMRSKAREDQPTDGTVLVPTADRGNASGTPFITLQLDAGVRGLVVYYIEQEKTNLPVPYPWAISMVAANTAVEDVELLNPWNGILAVAAHRHFISRVQGQPLNIGIKVDETYDIGRIEDVHFNPWYSCDHPFIEYQLTHGVAFVMGRSDWEYVFNTFVFAASVGYLFVETPTGAMNGNFLGIGADLAINASVQVDAAQAPGLLITNGEFTAFSKPQWINTTQESSQVVVKASNTGAVKFVDSSFWGPCSQIALIDGTGSVTFSACEFVQWDLQKKDGRAAIRAYNGSVALQGNEFLDTKKQVELGPGVGSAIIVGNVCRGKDQIESHCPQAQIGLNSFAQ